MGLRELKMRLNNAKSNRHQKGYGSFLGIKACHEHKYWWLGGDGMTVHHIKSIENKDTIEALEIALEKAKSGEIVSASIAWVTKEESIAGYCSGGPTKLIMWASIQHLSKSYYQDVVLKD